MRVDLDAIAANWRRYASLGPQAAAVIKADAYGLGAERVAPALAAAGACTFFAATFEEAIRARAALGAGPSIFVLEGLVEPADAYVAAGLQPILNSPAEIARWISSSAACPFAVHIDTGMNRLGLRLEEVGAAAAALAAARPSLVMSHLACASDPLHPMNALQRQRFVEAASAFPAAPLSLSASAGAMLGPDFGFDLTRPGVGLYGDAGFDQPHGPALSPAFTLEAPILQVRTVLPGETVGYGATFVAQQLCKIATIAVGYADGVLRALSGRGYGMLSGRRCEMRGRVSMDLLSLDVTLAGDAAQVGAMVELIGPAAPLHEAARLAGTSSYELLTGLRGLNRAYLGGTS